MNRYRVALVGAGRHGLRYARHVIADFPQLELAGIWRRDQAEAQRSATELGCRHFADYRELIAAPGVDLVIVAVPPALHPDIVEHCAAARRAVLLEKPAAIDLDAGRRMRIAVQRAGTPLMVAQTLRFNGVVKAIKQAIAEIAPIHALRISQRFEPSRPGWVDQPELSGGGVMMLTGIHSFDMARHLSDLEAVACCAEISRVGTTVQTEDNFGAVITFGDARVIASIAGSRATASRSGPIEIAGANGTLIADHVLNVAILVRGNVVTPIDVGPPLPTVRETLQAFVSAVDRGGQMPVTLDDGLRAVAIARACFDSAKSGRRVAVAAFDAEHLSVSQATEL
ncbi:MAG TPA: Gfo/Idh/MocA family oxidoreductase [Terriglobales bacterium]|nr:Gfo/Idh/MocA family oxidoreductase [Terriglobales bacterium]